MSLQIEIKTWNATVANLTLMALGSSAPEILLSLIEISGNDFFSGDLGGPHWVSLLDAYTLIIRVGPSTIVGSAAFNLLVIIAICVVAIPEQNLNKGETGFRKVHAPPCVSVIRLTIRPRLMIWESTWSLPRFPFLRMCG